MQESKKNINSISEGTETSFPPTLSTLLNDQVRDIIYDTGAYANFISTTSGALKISFEDNRSYVSCDIVKTEVFIHSFPHKKCTIVIRIIESPIDNIIIGQSG